MRKENREQRIPSLFSVLLSRSGELRTKNRKSEGEKERRTERSRGGEKGEEERRGEKERRKGVERRRGEEERSRGGERGEERRKGKKERSSTVVDDAVLQQRLAQVHSLVRFTDLSALQQPRHKLTGTRNTEH